MTETEKHVSQSTLDRLFLGKEGGPLNAAEFDALHRHLDGCAWCRERFERQNEESLKEGEVLTEAQSDAILRVAMEKGESRMAAEKQEQVAAWAAKRAPSWVRAHPLVLGFGGAALAAAVVLILLPTRETRQGQMQPRGVEAKSPPPQLFCTDAEKETATPAPARDGQYSCPSGRQVSLDANAILGLGWVSVVACDSKGCLLVKCRTFDNASLVAMPGPTMKHGSRFTIFTIWSNAPLSQRDVEVAVEVIHARGGIPDEVDRLPLEIKNEQVAARVVAEAPP